MGILQSWNDLEQVLEKRVLEIVNGAVLANDPHSIHFIAPGPNERIRNSSGRAVGQKASDIPGLPELSLQRLFGVPVGPFGPRL